MTTEQSALEMLRGPLAVVGAGTMGAGIALVALQSGANVILCDVSPGVLDRAKTDIEQRLARWVEKGQVAPQTAVDYLARLHTSNTLADLAPATVVIEAVPERMDLKQSIFTQLEEICAADAVLASNTSSLSVTVLASKCKHPERVIGMHFFNPAPVMRLVEVIVGDDTSPDVVDHVTAMARAFGKAPIVCKDTPGFIVNRVARNYYGEALRIAGDGTASQDSVDFLMEAAGFRMGPFTLMDLIGIDVNYDVTQAVYQAFHHEPRYRPHLLQERLVASGRLGRKTGRGFYRYAEDGRTLNRRIVDVSDGDETTGFDPVRTVVIGDTPLASMLRDEVARMSERPVKDCGLVYGGALQPWDAVAVKWRADEVEAYLRQHTSNIVLLALAGEVDYVRCVVQAVERGVRSDVLIATSLAGPSATEQASWLAHPHRLRGFSMVLPRTKDSFAVEWSIPWQPATDPSSDRAGASQVDRCLLGLFSSMGATPVQVHDGAGGVVLRILTMIFNEAAEVIREGAADAHDVDTGMKLGTNYPLGPVEWTDVMGISTVWYTLSALWREFGDSRYRPSPRLRQMVLAERTGERASQSLGPRVF